MKYFLLLYFCLLRHPWGLLVPLKVVFLSLLLVLGVSTSFQASAQTSRLERVLASKELRACIWTEYYSISYRNPKTRELSGIDIAITQELAKELGVRLRYVDSNFAQLFEALEQDRCDIASHAIGITPDRLARLQFSQAYLKSGLFAVKLKSKDEFAVLADAFNDMAFNLSGGQQQRLCIARALATGPELLLFDEPTSALDPNATANIEDLIHRLRDKVTILIVTHNMQQAARVSDYTAFMYLGELIEFGETDAVFTRPTSKRTEDYITGRYG